MLVPARSASAQGSEGRIMNARTGSIVLVALLASGTAAQRADFEARREAARAELRGALEGYVEWCQASNLFNERRKACELLLELEPAHTAALKTLGYTRDKSGAWQPPAKPKAFRDFDKQALAEAPARWRAATEGYVQAMLGLLEAGELSAEQREQAAAEALRFDPDNARLHGLLGDVASDKGWVLPETLRAKAQRELLRGHVKQALEGAVSVAVPVALSERERKIPLRFEAVAAPGLRVVGTASKDELQLTAQAVLALESFLQAVFTSDHELPLDTTVFLLSDPAQRAPFVAHHPSIPPDERAAYERLEGGGVQGTNDFAFWTGDMQRRIDGSVRLVLGYWLSGAFQIDVRQGWVYEGFGLFLTRALVRTRMTWLAEPASVGDPQQGVVLRQRLLDPATNWMDESLRLLQEKRQPPLGELFKKSALQLTTEDVLTSYTLATYLLEAHPEIVPKLLSRLGTGYSASAAFQEGLGMDLATFERHLARWLKERN